MEIKVEDTSVVICDMCNSPKPEIEVEKVWCCNDCKCVNNESKPQA